MWTWDTLETKFDALYANQHFKSQSMQRNYISADTKERNRKQNIQYDSSHDVGDVGFGVASAILELWLPVSFCCRTIGSDEMFDPQNGRQPLEFSFSFAVQ